MRRSVSRCFTFRNSGVQKSLVPLFHVVIPRLVASDNYDQGVRTSMTNLGGTLAAKCFQAKTGRYSSADARKSTSIFKYDLQTENSQTATTTKNNQSPTHSDPCFDSFSF